MSQNFSEPSSQASSVVSSSSSTKESGAKVKAGDMKNIVLKIPEEVCTNEVASSLLEKEIRFMIVERPATRGLIEFERHVPYKAFDKFGVCSTQELVEMDQNVVLVFPLAEHLELIQNELEVINNDSIFPGTGMSDSESLTEWVQRKQRSLRGKKLTLVIHGQEAYLKKVHRAKQKEYRDRILHNGDQAENGNTRRKKNGRSALNLNLSKTEIQSALIHMQLHTNITYRFYEKAPELTELLYHYAKSIAEAPAKLEKLNNNGFDWYAVADSVGGVPVEEDGKGMKSLWIQQLCQFPGVGQESALAIARVYRSPKALYQAYRRCGSVDEGKFMLAEIPVTSGVGPLAKTRRLGPEASKKIYRFFTSTDGEKEIN